MANEITVSGSLAVVKGTLSFTRQNASLRANMSGTTYAGGASSIPTTAGGTALALGSVSTAGWSYFVNTDPTNYVEIGVQVGGTFYPFGKLKPGEAFTMRLGVNAPYARANTAACVLDYLIVSD